MSINFEGTKERIRSIKFRWPNFRKLNWNTILTVLSYFHILAIIPYFASKEKPFMRFHAKQGLILLAFLTLSVFTFFITAVPWILIIFYVFCFIFGIINVILGRERRLPLIGKLAERI